MFKVKVNSMGDIINTSYKNHISCINKASHTKNIKKFKMSMQIEVYWNTNFKNDFHL